MDAGSRIFRHRDLWALGEANVETRFVRQALDSTIHQSFDARALFLERHEIIRHAMSKHRRKGILLLAFDAGTEPVAEGWVEASHQRTRTFVVGRHSRADVLITADETYVSLRHLALLVRASPEGRVRVRLLDLATQVGFADEQGRPLEAVQVEGPMFFSIGAIRFVLLVTGGAPLPTSPHTAYAALPKRVFLEERDKRAPVGPLAQGFEARGWPAGTTPVIRRVGPQFVGPRFRAANEAATARISVRGSGASATHEVGVRALETGILIGRYPRCTLGTDPGGIESDHPRELSRVHLLLVHDGAEVLAVDLASTNGTWFRGEMVRARALRHGDVLGLTWGPHLELLYEDARATA